MIMMHAKLWIVAALLAALLAVSGCFQWGVTLEMSGDMADLSVTPAPAPAP